MNWFVVPLSLCFVLMAAVECLPLAPTAASPAASTTTVEDLLRLHNVSRQDIETSRQQHLAAHHHSGNGGGGSVNHFPPAAGRHAPPLSASSVQKAIRNR